jgi:hypothetical protein
MASSKAPVPLPPSIIPQLLVQQLPYVQSTLLIIKLSVSASVADSGAEANFTEVEVQRLSVQMLKTRAMVQNRCLNLKYPKKTSNRWA